MWKWRVCETVGQGDVVQVEGGVLLVVQWEGMVDVAHQDCMLAVPHVCCTLLVVRMGGIRVVAHVCCTLLVVRMGGIRVVAHVCCTLLVVRMGGYTGCCSCMFVHYLLLEWEVYGLLPVWVVS